MPLAAYTKLEAVNAMLMDAGERPVDTLTDPNRQDVVTANATFDEVSRQEQLQGWWFNTELFEVTPNGSGQYVIPSSLVKVDVRRAIDGAVGAYPEISNPTAPAYNFVVRNGVLYDTISGTDSGFTTSPLKLVGVRLLDFDELPETAKRAFTVLASIQYQMRLVGSETLDAALRQKAFQARQELAREEQEQQDYNLQVSPRFRTIMLNR